MSIVKYRNLLSNAFPEEKNKANLETMKVENFRPFYVFWGAMFYEAA